MKDEKPKKLKIRKGAGQSIPSLPPDDPIYTRGYLIGGRRIQSPKKRK